MKIKVPEQRVRTSRASAPNPEGRLMWAYGSNLSIARMAQRCHDADPVASLYLRHGKLVFRGVADVVIRKKSMVPGGLWRLSAEDERALDRYEGAHHRFYLKRYFTIEIDGEREEVLFYQMQMNRGVMPPTEEYLRIIEQGYDDFSLDKSYLDEALSSSWDDKEITPVLRQRHQAKGRPQLAQPFFKLTEEELLQAGATPLKGVRR